MMSNRRPALLPRIVCLLVGVLCPPSLCVADDGVEFFEKKIRPVLARHCYRCHGAESKELKGELRLDLKSGWQRGGESGEPAIVPGKPDESLLIKAVRHEDNVSAMPPGQPQLSKQIIADLTEWVRIGAPDPRVGTDGAGGSASWDAEFRRRLDWWSLRPVADVPVPDAGENWSDEPVDRFILRGLVQRQLHPVPDADALTLLRRLSFVLTGLPPSPTDVKTFPAKFADDPEAALAALVDDLLKSPHFGERIARHWMDVVRYTDTYGYEWDNPAKGSWEYRDYLTRAFNRDVGFDQLIREQIAGDLLATPRVDAESGFNESLIGPMFYHMGEHRHGDNVRINGVREEMIDNKIDAFSKAFLALTVACARCHDHKLDAVSQKDYYALAGVFMTPRWTSRSIEAPEKNAATIAELTRLRDTIQRRIGEIWAKRMKPLAAGETLQQWSVANRPSLEKAKQGDIEWVLKHLLTENDEDTVDAWQRLVTEWRTTNKERRESNEKKFTRLIDFSKSDLPDGWVTDGDGMRTGYAAGGEPLVSLEGKSVVQRLLPRGFHTHALSTKLPGALRLPSQEALPGKFVSVSLAGGEWSGYLRLADNGFQTETVTFLSQPQPAWQTLADIAPTNGIQRIAYEIATSDLNPNFPPRTGVAKAGGTTLPNDDEGFDKRSWLSITGIVSHDQAGSPADDLQRFAGLFEGTAPANSQEAWGRVGGWLARSVTACGHGRADNSDVMLVNWLLARGLLPNSLSDDSELARLVNQYREVEKSLPFPRTANSMDERGVAPVNYALNIRGDIRVRGGKVPRGLPQVFSVAEFEEPQPAKSPESSRNPARRLDVPATASGRLQLASFLTDPRHGLAARVYVNRVWQWVFGNALVRTPNDFGHLGAKPSHPELLDYLTHEFIADGWSTKRLIRRLVLSRTFRQSGKVAPLAGDTDPGNRWLHHFPTRRLEAEAIRDALLAASGRLDRTLYGRPINPRRHVEDSKKRLFSGPVDGNGRRSIYLEVSIMDRSKFLQSFNAPDPKLPTGRRDVTSVPAQALVMLNDPFVLAMAEHWSGQLVQDGNASVEARVQAMFLQALGRPPQPEEAARWAAFVKTLASGDGDLPVDRAAWKHAAHTMFNLQEFIHYR